MPYVTAWSTERHRIPAVVRHPSGKGIGFSDEMPYDRDADGVLWVRQTIGAGTGRALFPTVHSLRQRRAVSRLLCQVCGADTLEQDPERQLFVLKDVGRPVGEGELTTAAPVCPPCALIAVKHCPHLLKHAAAWVERPMSWGVAGILYDQRTLLPLPGDDLIKVSYDDPAVRWVLATRLVLSLRGCSPVNVSDIRTTVVAR
ncbi:hypothetical protein [Actinacidiphila sp. ITFR-21]|uniref:hypothetical protein n=1 Tax=Actinacidiphila sp. ITFR-21 TaxID=3075199 RepID=UPI00288962C3|nr:hypothetical protein [Streptomyces sp. ITFR-21]WNI20079.1 hypothetical protein RLT57_31565 [Streptomyces sp. ITFR-21]